MRCIFSRKFGCVFFCGIDYAIREADTFTHMAALIDLNAEMRAKRRAVLVGIKTSDSSGGDTQVLLDELGELVRNLGMEVLHKRVVNVRTPNPHFLIGRGAFGEIVSLAKASGADTVVVDCDLTGAQQRNWETESGLDVANRQEVILDIFALRARTKEARLQVELAKLEYSLPRLRKTWSHLDQQRGGGFTTRGGGERRIELDRRTLEERISKLKTALSRVRLVRGLQRRKRERMDIPTVAVVGYTNAGKTSLINALSSSDLLAQDKLFATLDPSTRKVRLPNGVELLATDTVGFVRNLPHRFVEAFKATLEEAVCASFLIHVVDASNAECAEHIKTTLGVLRELGADSKRIITVLNKTDLSCDPFVRARLADMCPEAVSISVKTGSGIPALLMKMEDACSGASVPMTLSIPLSDYDAVARLYKLGAVRASKNLSKSVRILASVPKRYVSLYSKYEAGA